MNALMIVGCICLVFLVIELIILAFTTKNPLHIHGNSKVLLTLFLKKDEYNTFKKAAKDKGFDSIEPYIESLIKKDIEENK